MHGVLESGQDIAVKKLLLESRQGLREFFHEVCLLALGTTLEPCLPAGLLRRYRSQDARLPIILRRHSVDQTTFSSGAITKRMTAIEELAGIDVLCSEKTRTLTLNKLIVDKNLIEKIRLI